jgi:ABC-type Fe3+ transport system substrate-binding protein
VRESDAGEPSADFAFSSSMDLQMKLANDGYAQPSSRCAVGKLAALGQLARTPLMR